MIENTEVSGADLANWLGVTRQRISQLVEEGVLVRSTSGRFLLQESVRAFIGWQRDYNRRAIASEEVQKLQVAKVRALELKNAQTEKRLIPTEDAFDVIDRMMGVLIPELDTIPARATQDLALRGTIEDLIDAARARVAEFCLAESRRLSAG